MTDFEQLGREVFPETAKRMETENWFYAVEGYNAIVQHCGEVLVEASDHDYQGDTFALVRGKDGRVGYVQFGWGSCSGCDALQACNTLADLGRLANSIVNEVRWFSDVAEARTWLAGAEERNDYYVHSDAYPRFRRAVEALRIDE